MSHFEAPYAVRPVFYGLALWPFHWGTFFSPALFMQSLVVAHIIYLTTRVCGCDLRRRGFLWLVGGLVLFTPISFHVSHLLPDIVVGVLILALFLLGFCKASLRPVEFWYVLLLATAAATFHVTALAVGLALFATSVAVALIPRWRRRVSPLAVLAPVLLATGISLAFSVLVFEKLTLTPKNPPHVLARILADGPGREFLRVTCPDAGFALCAYQDRLTGVEDDFLWRLLPSIPPEDGRRIKAEQGAVVWGTVRMLPVQVVEGMLRNTFRQLVTFDSETQVSPAEWQEFQETDTPFARSLRHTGQSVRMFDGPAIHVFNDLHALVAAIGLIASLVVTVMTVRARLFRPVALAATVFAGLIANAFACGAFGGVFPRYEGRVIWLIPLVAAVSALALMRVRVFAQRRRLGAPIRLPASDRRAALLPR